MKKFFSRLWGGLGLHSWLSSTPRDNPDTFFGDEWADTTPACATTPDSTVKSTPPQKQKFVHYLGQFDDLKIEINGQPVQPEQIRHYKGTRLTSEKFAVDVGDTTYVFWNNPCEQQKKIQLNMKTNPATDLGDMRGESFGIHHLESLPGAFDDFDEPAVSTTSVARRDWQPQTGTADKSHRANAKTEPSARPAGLRPAYE